MPRSVRRPSRIACAWWLATAGLCAGAGEPDGVFALRYGWEGPDHLRVTLETLVPLEDVVVTWKAPPGMALRAERAPGEPPVERVGGGERLALGELPERAGRILRLRVERGQGDGRIAVVLVEAQRGGRTVRESLGIPVAPGETGRARGGAIEFDAVIETP